jgi:hypothetical protein
MDKPTIAAPGGMALTTAASPPVPSDEVFTCFPRLPLELRLKVFWRTLPGPRIVRLVFKERDYSYNNRSGVLSDMESYATIPVILHVCKESREEALRQYQLQFAIGSHLPNVYFNFKIDTLYFGPLEDRFGPGCPLYVGKGQDEIRYFVEQARREDMAKVQFLAVGTRTRWNYGNRRLLKAIATKFPHLKRLTEIYNVEDLEEIWEQGIYADQPESSEISIPKELKDLWESWFEDMKEDMPGWNVPEVKTEYDTYYGGFEVPDILTKAKANRMLL